MKKITSLILALVMVVTFSATAFAATITTGDQDIAVEARYQDSTTTTTVYSVDVSWGAMQFTYTESGSMTWNPADHTYTGNTSATWTANGNAVTVTNHSNADVAVSFTFNALESYNTVTGSFNITSQTLNAGVVGEYDNADMVTATLTLAGTLAESITEFTKVGTITVTIA